MSALAHVLFDDAQGAEHAITQTFLDACTPDDIAIPSVSRHELARYVFVLHTRRRALSHTGLAVVEKLSQLQRTAIALGLFGEHTYREIAILMDLPPEEVAGLMRSGLLEAAR